MRNGFEPVTVALNVIDEPEVSSPPLFTVASKAQAPKADAPSNTHDAVSNSDLMNLRILNFSSMVPSKRPSLPPLRLGQQRSLVFAPYAAGNMPSRELRPATARRPEWVRPHLETHPQDVERVRGMACRLRCCR